MPVSVDELPETAVMARKRCSMTVLKKKKKLIGRQNPSNHFWDFSIKIVKGGRSKLGLMII